MQLHGRISTKAMHEYFYFIEGYVPSDNYIIPLYLLYFYHLDLLF